MQPAVIYRGWPAQMDAETAAAYLSDRSFQAKAGTIYPAGVKIGKRYYWRKTDLDRALDRLHGGGGNEPEAMKL
jgi:hypothetical protein